jgi:hypothetical protein
MINPRPTSSSINNARFQLNTVRGEMIAHSVLAVWSVVKRVARYVREQAKIATEFPDSYSTSLRNPYRSDR